MHTTLITMPMRLLFKKAIALTSSTSPLDKLSCNFTTLNNIGKYKAPKAIGKPLIEIKLIIIVNM